MGVSKKAGVLQVLAAWLPIEVGVGHDDDCSVNQ